MRPAILLIAILGGVGALGPLLTITDVLSLSAGTPSCTRKSLADDARDHRAQLYSADPRSSQCPSTMMVAVGKSAKICLSVAASAVRAA